VASEDELRARAIFSEMLIRISQGPHVALGVAETVGADEVRAAFLELTKQFHPARYGRMSPELYRMANEVFLGIKAAHDQLVKALGSTGRAARSAPPDTNTRGDTLRGIGMVSRSGTNPMLARGTERATTRPSSSVLPTPSSGSPTVQADPLQRPHTTPSAGSPAVRSSASQTGMRAPAPPPDAGKRQTPAVRVPVQRPPTPTSIPPKSPTPIPTAGLGSQPVPRATPPGAPARPSSPMPAVRLGSPAAPRPTTPSVASLNPPIIRYGARTPDAPQRDQVLDERSELQRGLDLLSSKEWTAARLAFHALAAKVPQSKQYRSLLCYARGRETASTGRIDDAALEFQRALQLDPELEIAKQALRELGRKSRF
jgi:hypothetical protein